MSKLQRDLFHCDEVSVTEHSRKKSGNNDSMKRIIPVVDKNQNQGVELQKKVIPFGVGSDASIF